MWNLSASPASESRSKPFSSASLAASARTTSGVRPGRLGAVPRLAGRLISNRAAIRISKKLGDHRSNLIVHLDVRIVPRSLDHDQMAMQSMRDQLGFGRRIVEVGILGAHQDQ